MHRSRPFRRSSLSASLSVLLLALLCQGTVQAQESPVDEGAEKARAEKMREEAKALREAAEVRFKADEIACYERFLVNSCIDRVRQRHVEDTRQARALDLEAGRIELAEKNRRYAERMAGQAEQAPQKAVEKAEQEARNRADSEARLRALADKDAGRIEREQEGKSRALHEAEARQSKEAADARRRAAEAAAAAQRASQAESDRRAYKERAAKAAEKRAEKAEKLKQADGAKTPAKAAEPLMPGR